MPPRTISPLQENPKVGINCTRFTAGIAQGLIGVWVYLLGWLPRRWL